MRIVTQVRDVAHVPLVSVNLCFLIKIPICKVFILLFTVLQNPWIWVPDQQQTRSGCGIMGCEWWSQVSVKFNVKDSKMLDPVVFREAYMSVLINLRGFSHKETHLCTVTCIYCTCIPPRYLSRIIHWTQFLKDIDNISRFKRKFSS